MEPLPQLRMIRPLTGDLPEIGLPEGYSLREASTEDAAGVARVQTIAFGDPWDEAKTLRELLDNSCVPKTFVIEKDGDIVASASYQVWPDTWPESGWVHWVAADPSHKGMRLGYIVTAAVVIEASRNGMTQVVLTTDDPRLAAISTYLKLGFQPDMWHESHEERWAKVFAALKAS